MVTFVKIWIPSFGLISNTLADMKVSDSIVHKVAIHEIKDAVDRIAVTHPEGEAFFDELDEYIKHLATTAVYESLFAKADAQVIVLSGGFGRCVADRIDAGTLPKIPYILFNGGMRKGNEPEILRDHFPVRDHKVKAVFLDDTIYGGMTFKLIQDYLNTKYQWHEHIIIDSAVVVYDGCPIKKDHVDSIFRYYDFYSATPNYDFKEGIEGVVLKPNM